MRELLFRAKGVYGKDEWVEGNLVCSTNVDDEYKVIIIPIINSDMFIDDYDEVGFERWYKVQADTLCQYTGLTDKNGVKIRENDIIKYFDDLAGQWKIDKIIFNETHASFVRLHRGRMGLQYLYIDEGIANHCEVIGNIFDNPELLEEK